MQDDKIGKKCEICQQKDYIPYTCKKCSRILCDQHYWEHPCVTDQYNPPKHSGQPTNKKEYRCTLQSCNKKIFTVNHFYCEKCNKLFCLSHRMPEQHLCRGRIEHSDTSCKLI